MDPIPGGFPTEAQIERVAQVRLTESGLGFIETEFQNLMSAYLRMECAGPTDVACPAGFIDLASNQANPAVCDVANNACVEQLSGAPGPLIGFAIDQTNASNAIICRDDVSDPQRRNCAAWLRFEGLQIQPVAPDTADITVTVQIQTTDIPFRYDPLGLDCLVRLNSGASGGLTQDLLVNAQIQEYTPPTGVGRQLKVEILGVDAMIPDDDVDVSCDPVHGNCTPIIGGDWLGCGAANLGVIKNILIPQLTGELGSIVSTEVDNALGRQCGPGLEPCPAMTNCNSDNLCEENVSGDIVPVTLGFEGRVDFASLLAGFTQGRPGRSDISFMVGGQSSADATGLNLGALGGAEVVNFDPTCAQMLPSPRLRPGFTPPPVLPTEDLVDLDFDGTPETPYMVAGALSEAFLDQVIWSVYSAGIFCTQLSTYDIEFLNTGALSLVLPSLDQLTHKDRYDWAVYPVAISLFPSSEPEVKIGSGQIMGDQSSPELVDPLLELRFPDMQLNFQAMIEDRWVHLMSVQLDMALGFGAMVTPNNEILLVIGDLGMTVQNVDVSNAEILAESEMELEESIPALLGLAAPQLTGAIPAVPLPGAAELGGFDLNVLGVRGVSQGGDFPNLAIYADLGFDPSQVPNLSFAAQTVATLEQVELPEMGAMSVTGPGEVNAPTVVLNLGDERSEDLEYQIRINNGLWSAFFSTNELRLQRPEFAVQGLHTIEVRSRKKGAYRTLDPTPVKLEVMIDPAPPKLRAELTEGGLNVWAFDAVSEKVELTASLNGVMRDLEPDERGFVAMPEAVDAKELIIFATDEAQNTSRQRLRAEPEAQAEPSANSEASGCTCAAPKSRVGGWGALGLIAMALGLVLRRR